MGKVTESIWSSNRIIICLAEISHIEKLSDDQGILNRIFVYFKYSKSNNETQMLEPFVYLDNKDGESLKKSFCIYRHELEFETLSDNH
jgi:hypothetical protein